MKKTISWILIFTLILTQCPLEARAAGASSGGRGSAPSAPFQSEFYRTNLITGTASLAVPIVVPPGRKGVQPNLAISYSSSAGNSWCGVGWNLDLGSIQRDTRNGIPNYDSTDTFIATVGGANMKLVDIGSSEYRAQIESGFMRFIYQEAGNYWEVYDKGGTKYYFGHNSDSRLTNSSGTLSWSLDEVLDTNGNYMAISYSQDQGQIYPSQIQYTGNKNTGYLPKHTVDFILQSRTDHPSSYRSGYKIVTAQRLKEIQVKVNNEWVRRYVLTYEYSPDTNRSILSKVTEYGQDNETPLSSEKSFTYSVRGTNPGGALYPDLILNGGTLTIDGERHFNSIILRNGAVLTCNPGPTGMTLLVDEDVVLESGSKIDLDGKGYAGGSGGAGGAKGDCSSSAYGRGGMRGSVGSGPGAGSGGTDGGNGQVGSYTNIYGRTFYGGGGGGGGGAGKKGYFGGAIEGAAGNLPSAATYNQDTVHAGAGGAGASGGGGGGSHTYYPSNCARGTNGTAGGAGGRGGGYLKIVCRNLTVNSGCGIYTRGEDGASGGNGGNGGVVEAGGWCAGGGGGGHGAGGGAGGGIHIQYHDTLTNNGTISVSGGAGGSGGFQGSGGSGGADGSTGPAGADGRYYAEQISQASSSSESVQSYTEDRTQSSSTSSETGDNLWNVYFYNYSYGDENYGPVEPFETDTVYTQPSYSGGVWWDIDSDGDIHYGGAQDHYICAWTLLYVEEAKTLSLSYYNQVDNNGGFYLVPPGTPEGTSWSSLQVDKTNVPLQPGINIFYITSYNENQGFSLEMDGGIANQVDLMNSSLIDQPQFNLSPIMGDFNGDGRVDRGKYYKETGVWEVALSEGDEFGAYSNWCSGFGVSTDCEPIISDFNNDGLTDVGVYDRASGDWAIAISDGSQFNPDGNWLTGFNTGEQYLPIVGDFNGDTKIDVGTYNESAGVWSVALSGSSFTPDGDWLTDFGGSDAYDLISGDFNGDGLTDVGVHHQESGDVSVALCNGSSFVSSGSWIPGFAPDKTILTGDFNNDGLTDIGSFDNEQGLWSTALCTGASFSEEGCWLKGFGQGKYITAHTGDFSGDGINNAGIFNWQDETWAQIPSSACPSDLLVEFSNGLGGKTAITYQPSTAYDNSGPDSLSDLPFPIQTVSSVAIEDGLNNPAHTINYTYEDGLFDFKEKEFIGFGRVTVIDAEGNISDTWYNQEMVDGLYIYKGMPTKQELKKQLPDESTELYQSKSYSYDYTTPYPGLNYSPRLIQEESASYDTLPQAKTSRASYEYDTYGNVTLINSAGDIDTDGDKREQHTEYTYDTDSWILGLPAHSWLEDAFDQKVSESWYYYDSHSSHTATPTKGNLTKERAWLDTGDAPETTYEYDDYGNVIKTTDARGNSTTTTYDNTYHTFPNTITNALGHTIQYTYDPKTGQILTSTDPNGQTSTNEYDNFGRLVRVFGPNDDAGHPAVWYDYDLEIRPVKITTHTRTEHNTGDPNRKFVSYAFYDGLGRLIQTKSQAEEASKQIVGDVVTFNSQGKVKEKYLPYYIDITSEEEAMAYSVPDYSGPKVSFEYDTVGRLIETSTLNDEGAPISSTVQYQRWSKTSTDANGNKTQYNYDAYGQLSKVEEFDEGEIYTTNYIYDALGNLTQTVDNQSNTATITYDSLGRKTSMDDPDMGEWSYEYDANGNLVRQTDAKGQIIEFTYDALNRLTLKSLRAAEGGEAISAAIYSYDDTTKPNCIGRLSKVEDQSGQTEFFYDNLGREIKSIKTVDDTPYTVERTYDALDRLTTVTYPNSKVVSYTYNRQGGIETVSTPDGSITNIDYTASDQIELIQYSNGTQTQYAYNSDTLRLKQLLTSSSAEILQSLSYDFDNVGNVSAITDSSPDGTNSQSFQYDDLNRLTSAIGEAYGTITYTYDSIGNMTQKGDLTLNYGEGDAGPHAVTSTSGSKSSTMNYDANGNMLSKGSAEYEYDIENRLTSVSSLQGDEGEAAVSIDLTPGWNFIGIPLELADYSISNALSSIEGKYDQVTRYNSTTEKFESFINNGKFDQFNTFSLGEGYLIHITESCTLTVTGEPLVSSARDLKRGWNLIASPALEGEISTEEALNNLVQGLDYSKVSEYNGSGFTDNPASLKPGKSYYIHMLQDKIWEIPSASKETTTMVYDGDGGRVKKVTTSQGHKVTSIYIGSLYEEDSEGNAKCHIFLGSNRAFTIDHRLSTIDCYYYHSDHLGSSNIISDSQGNQAQLLEYTPFGLTKRAEGEYNTNYRFTGKLFDNTGLYYYGARYYDPELGRFITADPTIQHPYDPQDFNRYAYARNNPIKYIDPTGHGILDVIGRIIGGIVGGAVAVVTGNPAAGVAVYSAISSGFSAIESGANIGQAIGIGVVSGLTAYAVGNIVGNAVGDTFGTFWGGLAAASVGGAAGGAAGAAMWGGDVERGALGGLAGGAGSFLFGPVIGAGLGAEAAGGDFWEGALGGVATAAGYAIGSYTARKIASGDLQGAIDAGQEKAGVQGRMEVSNGISRQAQIDPNSEVASNILLASSDSFDTFYTQGAQAWSNRFQNKGPTAEGLAEATKEVYGVYRGLKTVVPPGQPWTGNPVIDKWIDVFNTATSAIEKVIEDSKVGY